MKLNLDLTNVEMKKAPSFTMLPDGDYVVEVVAAEIKDTFSGGSKLVVTLEVLEGTMAGATIRDSFNIVNASPKAELIARENLKTLATFIGVDNPSKLGDTDELLGCNKVSAKVVTDTYTSADGIERTNNKVAWYNLIPGQEVIAKTMPKKEASTKRPWK